MAGVSILTPFQANLAKSKQREDCQDSRRRASRRCCDWFISGLGGRTGAKEEVHEIDC